MACRGSCHGSYHCPYSEGCRDSVFVGSLPSISIHGMPVPMPRGCICPPTSEQTCKADFCPRQSMLKSPQTSQAT